MRLPPTTTTNNISFLPTPRPHLLSASRFVNFTDVLVDMGTYPLSNHPQAYPAYKHLKPYDCKGVPNVSPPPPSLGTSQPQD